MRAARERARERRTQVASHKVSFPNFFGKDQCASYLHSGSTDKIIIIPLIINFYFKLPIGGKRIFYRYIIQISL